MKIFRCDHCGQLIFFENTQCTRCGRTLAFLTDRQRMAALDPAGDGRWRIVTRGGRGAVYRLCRNYRTANVCNWAMPARESHELCPSCRLTRTLPDLSIDGHAQAWYRLEVAKRRLLYSLVALGLPIASRDEDPQRGLAFDFLAEVPPEHSNGPVLTGHANGVITINVAEADDAEREKRRVAMHEPYRTLLGHFRHEIGHYYWDRLIAGSARLTAFRERFGDERADYAAALRQHYARSDDGHWRQDYVSHYASSHPWEDWAETWAHYLHIGDTLQTARACGLSLRETPFASSPPNAAHGSFDELMQRWYPLTFALNSLNRGLGLADAYPFVLSPPAIDKLRFVHETIHHREQRR